MNAAFQFSIWNICAITSWDDKVAANKVIWLVQLQSLPFYFSYKSNSSSGYRFILLNLVAFIIWFFNLTLCCFTLLLLLIVRFGSFLINYLSVSWFCFLGCFQNCDFRLGVIWVLKIKFWLLHWTSVINVPEISTVRVLDIWGYHICLRVSKIREEASAVSGPRWILVGCWTLTGSIFLSSSQW